MGLEENKALIRRFYEEVWGRGNLDVADEVFGSLAWTRGPKTRRAGFQARLSRPSLRGRVDRHRGRRRRGPLEGIRNAHGPLGGRGTDGSLDRVFRRQLLPAPRRQGRRDLEPPG